MKKISLVLGLVSVSSVGIMTMTGCTQSTEPREATGAASAGLVADEVAADMYQCSQKCADGGYVWGRGRTWSEAYVDMPNCSDVGTSPADAPIQCSTF